MTNEELATLIEEAVQQRGRLMRDHSAHVGSMHAAILAVLKDNETKTAATLRRKENAWNIERAKLNHKIEELEARIEELNKH